MPTRNPRSPRTRNTNELRRAEFQWIKAHRLTVDHRYERPLTASKVRKIVLNFDPDAIGVLYVSKRADGSYVILDGMHRHAAILDMGWADQSVPCHVYSDLSLADEARLFREFNELRTRPKPIDLHRAAVVAGDERAVRIEKVLAGLGLRIEGGPGLGYVTAIGTLQSIYDAAGERTLKTTLMLATQAWGQESTSYNGEVLTAIAAILARHPHIDQDRLARALHRLFPKTLVTKARILKVELAGSVGTGNHGNTSAIIASLIVSAYNYRLAEKARILWDLQRIGRAFWTPERS